MFRASGLLKVSEQLRDCEETEVLACCSGCGRSWYILNRCRLRVCPICSYKQSQLRAGFILRLTHEMAYPKFITLSLPTWTGVPQEGIDRIRKYWNALREHTVLSPVKGGAYQIELKPKPTGWHIHIHVIADAKYIPYRTLFSAWRRITGVPVPQIHIKAATTDSEKAYSAKYASKAADYDAHPGAVVSWYKATKGSRLFATFGAWYHWHEPEDGDNGKFEPEARVCPFCEKQGTMFLYANGHFLYGGKEWSTISKFWEGTGPASRDLVGIRLALNSELDRLDYNANHQLKLEEISS